MARKLISFYKAEPRASIFIKLDSRLMFFVGHNIRSLISLSVKLNHWNANREDILFAFVLQAR